jgi:hypothetical protein
MIEHVIICCCDGSIGYRSTPTLRLGMLQAQAGALVTDCFPAGVLRSYCTVPVRLASRTDSVLGYVLYRM